MKENYPDGIELDPEEQKYEDTYEEFIPAPASERASIIKAARMGRRPLSIRIESSDIAALKKLAEHEGMPYQTLLGSIVHKYVTGTLVDIGEARKILTSRS